LDTAYAGISAGLEHWLRQELGVAVLTAAAAAEHLLNAHLSGQLAADVQELVQHARFIALHGSESLKQECEGSLLLALDSGVGGSSSSSGGGSSSSSTVQAGTDLYFLDAGDGWRLDEVLLPGEVRYLHPAYAELQGDDLGMVLQLLAQLGVHTRLPPDARQLQHAIGARGRWRPLLLCLRDTWASYCALEQAEFVQLLRHLQVGAWSHVVCRQLPVPRLLTAAAPTHLCLAPSASITAAPALQVTTSSGQHHALCDCFLPSACSHISGKLLQLMQQLALPILEMPQPQDERWGPFLAGFGVSTDLDWGALSEILTQLSTSSAAPKLDSMVSLYERVHALCTMDGRTAAAVCQAFRVQPLVFLPSDKQRPQALWLTSTQVLWNGRIEWYPHKHFISRHYRVRGNGCVCVLSPGQLCAVPCSPALNRCMLCATNAGAGQLLHQAARGAQRDR
jgi:hypothetical protein